jgi:diadenosine tetraphosphatase ApaH/serine/threonine PP2A family protein phosphatase
MGGFGYSYKTLEEKVRFHRKRAKYHSDRAAEWERILSEIQRLQRLEQLPHDADIPELSPPKKPNSPGSSSRTRRNDFARDVLSKARE